MTVSAIICVLLCGAFGLWAGHRGQARWMIGGAVGAAGLAFTICVLLWAFVVPAITEASDPHAADQARLYFGVFYDLMSLMVGLLGVAAMMGMGFVFICVSVAVNIIGVAIGFQIMQSKRKRDAPAD